MVTNSSDFAQIEHCEVNKHRQRYDLLFFSYEPYSRIEVTSVFFVLSGPVCRVIRCHIYSDECTWSQDVLQGIRGRPFNHMIIFWHLSCDRSHNRAVAMVVFRFTNSLVFFCFKWDQFLLVKIFSDRKLDRVYVPREDWNLKEKEKYLVKFNNCSTKTSTSSSNSELTILRSSKKAITILWTGENRTHIESKRNVCVL